MVSGQQSRNQGSWSIYLVTVDGFLWFCFKKFLKHFQKCLRSWWLRFEYFRMLQFDFIWEMPLDTKVRLADPKMLANCSREHCGSQQGFWKPKTRNMGVWGGHFVSKAPTLWTTSWRDPEIWNRVSTRREESRGKENLFDVRLGLKSRLRYICQGARNGWGPPLRSTRGRLASNSSRGERFGNFFLEALF